MKNTVFLSAIAFSLCALAVLQSTSEERADFTPRSTETAEPVANATGMEQLMLALRADIETARSLLSQSWH